MRPGWRGAWEALTAGFRLMLSEPSMGAILIVNAVLNGPWMVALSLAIALIVTEYQPTFLGFGGLAAYALVMGAYGVGDVSGNIVAASVRFRRPMSTMFLGYVVMGIGFSVLAVVVWLLPPDRLLPAMMVGALLAGLGGPFFFVPMITRMQTVFHGHDIARVFRLRLVVMAAAMMVSSLVATWFFDLMGAVATQLGCGLLILADRHRGLFPVPAYRGARSGGRQLAGAGGRRIKRKLLLRGTVCIDSVFTYTALPSTVRQQERAMAKAFPTDNPFLRGYYGPVNTEADAGHLQITGEMPKELLGTLYRNGPNPQFAPRGAVPLVRRRRHDPRLSHRERQRLL